MKLCLFILAATGACALTYTKSSIAVDAVGARPAVLGTPTVSPKRLDFFYRGKDNRYYAKGVTLKEGSYRRNKWEAEKCLGGSFKGDPGVSRYQGGIVVAGQGSDGGLWFSYKRDSDQGYSTWNNIGGVVLDYPVGIQLNKGATSSVHFFARGEDRKFWYISGSPETYSHGSFNDWGGVFVSPPCAVSFSTSKGNSVGIIGGRGEDNKLWYRINVGSGWSGWNVMASGLKENPSCLAVDYNSDFGDYSAAAFFYQVGDQLQYVKWNGNSCSSPATLSIKLPTCNVNYINQATGTVGYAIENGKISTYSWPSPLLGGSNPPGASKSGSTGQY